MIIVDIWCFFFLINCLVFYLELGRFRFWLILCGIFVYVDLVSHRIENEYVERSEIFLIEVGFIIPLAMSVFKTCT